MNRESMTYDVVIVGAGPAGLSAAIRYAQLCAKVNQQPKICVVEKGSQVGAHIISGAVFDPRVLNQLIPNWQDLGAPLNTPATQDCFLALTPTQSFSLPIPPQMKNQGNYIISLGLLCQWLAKYAEGLGVEIYPGFAASAMLYNEKNEVIGVSIGDKGLDKSGKPKANYQPGIDLLAKQSLLAEGCRGSLSQQLIHRFDLIQRCPQTYGIGIKEIWEVPPEQHQPGKVIHTLGWPLDLQTYGGSFIYHWGKNLISIGFIVGLDYKNPYLNPYQEFQRFKHHPDIKKLLHKGQCISYGARAINEGGWQSLPKLTVPGAMLLGCSAGFLNVPKIKGSHYAMQSGILAAEAIFETFQTQKENPPKEITLYQQKIDQSWMIKELYQARNIRPAFRYGLLAGLTYACIDTYLLRGKAPWTFANYLDNTTLSYAKNATPIDYPKPDGIFSFDRMTSVARTNVFHAEDQVNHLKLIDPQIAVNINWKEYRGPEQRYCPAGVYEFIEQEGGLPYLQINAQNCIHCKTCDIKDPTQNIIWTAPEGGDGPNYTMM